MNLLFLVNALVLDGPTRATLTLARELRLMGHAPRIIALRRRGPGLQQVEQVTGIPAQLLGGGISPLGIWKGVRALRRVVREHAPDAIIPVLAAPILTALLSAPRNSSGSPVPLFPIHHGAHEWDERGPVVGAVVTRLMKWLLPRAAGQFVVSPHTGAELVTKIGLPLAATVLGNPVPPLSSDMTRPSGPPWTVGGCGRLVPLKNWHTLIEAIRILKSRGFIVSAEIVGDGPSRTQLEQQARKAQIEDQIRFLGYRESWHELARPWIAYVQPSLFESFGMAAAEGAAVGLPVVHPTTGALSWTVAPAGIEYGLPEDAEGLAQALEKLIAKYQSHPAEELAQRLRHSAEIRSKFDPTQVAHRLIETIRTSIAGSQP